MNFISDKVFDEYVEKYKNLTINEKKDLVENQIKEIIVVLDKINERLGKSNGILFNKEILDLEKENATDEDFVEAMFVYLCSIKELLAAVIESIN